MLAKHRQETMGKKGLLKSTTLNLVEEDKLQNSCLHLSIFVFQNKTMHIYSRGTLIKMLAAILIQFKIFNSLMLYPLVN